jgi:hypothetical protein
VSPLLHRKSRIGAGPSGSHEEVVLLRWRFRNAWKPSLNTTLRYMHLSPAPVRGAIRLLDLTDLADFGDTAQDFYRIQRMWYARLYVTENDWFIYGGESGIRTHGRFWPTHAFQACALNHSAISPRL